MVRHVFAYQAVLSQCNNAFPSKSKLYSELSKNLPTIAFTKQTEGLALDW